MGQAIYFYGAGFHFDAHLGIWGNRGQCAFPFIFVLRDFVWSD